MRIGAAVLLGLLATPAAAGSVDGIWGVARGSSASDVPACSGANVMVLRDGGYTKATLDVGTTEGPRDLVIGTAGFRFDGARVVVSPSVSLAQPEPRQVFRWDPVGDALLREEPAPALTWRRCPDRPLRPLTR